MIRIFALLMIGLPAAAQTTGTVAETTLRTVTATAGALVCVFTNPSPPAFDMRCSVGGAVKLQQTATPAVGTGGVAGSYVEGQENITWLVTQPMAGTVNYDIAANGTRKTGVF